MVNNRDSQTSPVRRITIDEKLEDGLYRVLITSLRNDTTEFNDDLSYWGEEYEYLIQPDNYRKILDMTKRNVKTWPWDSIYEGQVFLQGRFRINRNRSSRMMFVVDRRRRNFRRVDQILKEQVKKTYLAVLERRISDG